MTVNFYQTPQEPWERGMPLHHIPAQCISMRQEDAA